VNPSVSQPWGVDKKENDQREKLKDISQMFIDKQMLLRIQNNFCWNHNWEKRKKKKKWWLPTQQASVTIWIIISGFILGTRYNVQQNTHGCLFHSVNPAY